MNCQVAKNLIQPYLEGRLVGLERNEFVHHVTECGACETDVIAYREVFRALRHMPRASAPARLSVAVMAQLHAEGLVHEPRFPAARRVSDWFLGLPARARYPLAALLVIGVLYVPIGVLLALTRASVAGTAELFARGVVWAERLNAALSSLDDVEPYTRAARVVWRAGGSLVSPGTLLLVTAVAVGVVLSMSRFMKRRKPSGHALFSF